ncbi:hypothetical protein BK809_0003561 [Diplodia seriata]|uniref:DUF1763-domain-containing protein n=1 Tax=Diplodia seriata TaxID=420778 RepID=A0A1S8BG47_9PEZI|nr:hypothetical protein BK809_0003561 [Diplodia seriata]
MPPTDRDILRAYRRLYTWGLRAVQYSMPARFTLRDRLRRIFRTNDRASFDQRRIDNTLEFLRGATRERGLEHRIVKRLIHVWWHEHGWRSSDRYLNTWKSGRIARTIYDPFNHKIRMLNETMGMCIQ